MTKLVPNPWVSPNHQLGSLLLGGLAPASGSAQLSNLILPFGKDIFECHGSRGASPYTGSADADFDFGVFPLHSIEILPVFVCILPRLEGRRVEGVVVHDAVLVHLAFRISTFFAFIAIDIRSITSGANNVFFRTVDIKECSTACF